MCLESGRKHWAIRSSICSFTRTAYSLTCFALLTSLARSAALNGSHARSLNQSGAYGKVIYICEMNASISYSLNPLCTAPTHITSLPYVRRDNGNPHCHHRSLARIKIMNHLQPYKEVQNHHLPLNRYHHVSTA